MQHHSFHNDMYHSIYHGYIQMYIMDYMKICLWSCPIIGRAVSALWPCIHTVQRQQPSWMSKQTWISVGKASCGMQGHSVSSIVLLLQSGSSAAAGAKSKAHWALSCFLQHLRLHTQYQHTNKWPCHAKSLLLLSARSWAEWPESWMANEDVGKRQSGILILNTLVNCHDFKTSAKWMNLDFVEQFQTDLRMNWYFEGGDCFFVMSLLFGQLLTKQPLLNHHVVHFENKFLMTSSNEERSSFSAGMQETSLSTQC
jgi:hypothetical protein